jgi:hypothetical protein
MASNYELSQAAYERAHPLLECDACGEKVRSYEDKHTCVILLDRHQAPDGTWCPRRQPALFPRKRP